MPIGNQNVIMCGEAANFDPCDSYFIQMSLDYFKFIEFKGHLGDRYNQFPGTYLFKIQGLLNYHYCSTQHLILLTAHQDCLKFQSQFWMLSNMTTLSEINPFNNSTFSNNSSFMGLFDNLQMPILPTNSLELLMQNQMLINSKKNELDLLILERTIQQKAAEHQQLQELQLLLQLAQENSSLMKIPHNQPQLTTNTGIFTNPKDNKYIPPSSTCIYSDESPTQRISLRQKETTTCSSVTPQETLNICKIKQITSSNKVADKLREKDLKLRSKVDMVEYLYSFQNSSFFNEQEGFLEELLTFQTNKSNDSPLSYSINLNQDNQPNTKLSSREKHQADNKIIQTIEDFLTPKLNGKRKLNKSVINQKLTTESPTELQESPMTLHLEDIISSIELTKTDTSTNSLVIQEIDTILENFKSSQKVYFKKVRSAKEMLKDTKFHNLNKRIMRVLLQLLTNKTIVLSLGVPEHIYKFFLEMSEKLIQISKKVINNITVCHQYSHTHYNSMILQINQENYGNLQEQVQDKQLYQLLYDLDLSLSYEENINKILEVNIIKQYQYLILQHTLTLNKSSEDTPLQAIRSLYIDRVLKGMEKMNQGKIVQRF